MDDSSLFLEKLNSGFSVTAGGTETTYPCSLLLVIFCRTHAYNLILFINSELTEYSENKHGVHPQIAQLSVCAILNK